MKMVAYGSGRYKMPDEMLELFCKLSGANLGWVKNGLDDLGLYREMKNGSK